MTIQKLQYPFPWEKRRPYLKEQVFFVPEFYHYHHLFTLPSWQAPELFGNENPICIEYCSGNGEWIIQKAKDYPQINWIAVEKKFQRIRKIYSKKQQKNLTNLFLVCGEAYTFTKEYLPENILAKVFINFPDPWPKDRHAKHRLIQIPFVHEMHRVVLDQGKVVLVTDHEEYQHQIRATFSEVETWKFDSDQRQAQYGSSFFQRLWLSKGKEIYFLAYQNIKELCGIPCS